MVWLAAIEGEGSRLENCRRSFPAFLFQLMAPEVAWAGSFVSLVESVEETAGLQ